MQKLTCDYTSIEVI